MSDTVLYNKPLKTRIFSSRTDLISSLPLNLSSSFLMPLTHTTHLSTVSCYPTNGDGGYIPFNGYVAKNLSGYIFVQSVLEGITERYYALRSDTTQIDEISGMAGKDWQTFEVLKWNSKDGRDMSTSFVRHHLMSFVGDSMLPVTDLTFFDNVKKTKNFGTLYQTNPELDADKSILDMSWSSGDDWTPLTDISGLYYTNGDPKLGICQIWHDTSMQSTDWLSSVGLNHREKDFNKKTLVAFWDFFDDTCGRERSILLNNAYRAVSNTKLCTDYLDTFKNMRPIDTRRSRAFGSNADNGKKYNLYGPALMSILLQQSQTTQVANASWQYKPCKCKIVTMDRYIIGSGNSMDSIEVTEKTDFDIKLSTTTLPEINLFAYNDTNFRVDEEGTVGYALPDLSSDISVTLNEFINMCTISYYYKSLTSIENGHLTVRAIIPDDFDVSLNPTIERLKPDGHPLSWPILTLPECSQSVKSLGTIGVARMEKDIPGIYEDKINTRYLHKENIEKYKEDRDKDWIEDDMLKMAEMWMDSIWPLMLIEDQHSKYFKPIERQSYISNFGGTIDEAEIESRCRDAQYIYASDYYQIIFENGTLFGVTIDGRKVEILPNSDGLYEIQRYRRSAAQLWLYPDGTLINQVSEQWKYHYIFRQVLLPNWRRLNVKNDE